MRKTPSDLFIMLFAVSYLAGCSKGSNRPDAHPVISSIYPTSARGGDTITATGKNLPTDITIIHLSVNSKSAKVILATPDSLKAVVPDLAGSGKVILSVGAE